jgi:hypothetical protein
MRRDYFTLELQNAGDAVDGQPTVRVEFDGPTESFTERLTPDRNVDVAFRFQTAVDADEANGVFSVADRVTGEFIFEVNAAADAILDLIDAARSYGESTNDANGCYSVLLHEDGENRFQADKRTLLVYDNDGSLLRQHSLIPSGVEL